LKPFNNHEIHVKSHFKKSKSIPLYKTIEQQEIPFQSHDKFQLKPVKPTTRAALRWAKPNPPRLPSTVFSKKDRLVVIVLGRHCVGDDW